LGKDFTDHSTMSLRTIYLTPEQVAELAAPFTPAEAKAAMMAGVANAISQAGLLPSEAELIFQKFANDKFGTWGDVAANTMVWLPLGAGALGGAYTAYARHKIEQDFDDRGNPELATLKKKIQTYRTMSDDLRRTNRVEGGGQALPMPT